MTSLSTFFTTKIEDCGLLASIGDLGLAPVRCLFGGKIVREILTPNSKDTPTFQSTPSSRGFLKVIAAIVMLIPGLFLILFKCAAHLFSEVRQKLVRAVEWEKGEIQREFIRSLSLKAMIGQAVPAKLVSARQAQERSHILLSKERAKNISPDRNPTEKDLVIGSAKAPIDLPKCKIPFQFLQFILDPETDNHPTEHLIIYTDTLELDLVKEFFRLNDSAIARLNPLKLTLKAPSNTVSIPVPGSYLGKELDWLIEEALKKTGGGSKQEESKPTLEEYKPTLDNKDEKEP